MSSINTNLARTTTLQSANTILANLTKTQAALFQAQQQIQTGVLVAKPSDAPAKVASILQLQAAIEARTQQQNNLAFATSVINNVDQALSDGTDIANEAASIGSGQIGIGSSTETRRNQSTVIDGQLQSLIEIANRTSQGVALFGGSYTPPNGSLYVFDDKLGGVRYNGTDTNLQADLGMNRPLGINSNGVESFSALSTRVVGDRDLDPQATADTKLSDLNGARNLGVTTGAIRLTVDGTQVTLDLSGARTLGDVVTRVNDAIGGIDGTAGSLAVSPDGLSLTAAAGHSITLSDGLTGSVASDLGIAVTASGATVAGGDVDPRLTLDTPLAALGVSVDAASGLQVTQGAITKTLSLAGATTVRDLQNRLTQLDLGLRLDVSADGQGLTVVSDVSGPAFSIGEVGGGTTATDLGIRTFSRSTKLSDLNFGLGVSNDQGTDDFSIQLQDGTKFTVNIDGAATVGDVLDKITAAAQTALGAANVGAPGAAGTSFNVGLAPDGNGFYFEDHTSGSGEFRIDNVGTSLAATDLGFYKAAGSGGATIQGDDVGQIRVESVFTHLINLRDALAQDDSRGITLATSALQNDATALTQARADMGVRGQQVSQQTTRGEDMNLSDKSLLSDLKDADMTQAITRYSLLQQQFQAGLQVAAQSLQRSLLDYLQ